MSKGDGTATTTYPNKYFNETNGTTTKHVFAPGGDMIATIVTAGSTTTKQFIHTDHLGGTNIVTSEDAEILETSDFYPYGASRISTTNGVESEQRQFAGTERDEETALDYMQARFYSNERGQFISQDPVFINLGVDNRTKQVLEDPQLANAYSYARNNPLILKDPNGEDPISLALFFGIIGYGIADSIGETYVVFYDRTLDNDLSLSDALDVIKYGVKEFTKDAALGEKVGFLSSLIELVSDVATLGENNDIELFAGETPGYDNLSEGYDPIEIPSIPGVFLEEEKK